MEFTVQFKGMRDDGPALTITSSKPTLSDVDYIREQLNKNLPLEFIDKKEQNFKMSPIIKLDEHNARKIDIFKDSDNFIEVFVPRHFLNKYIYTIVHTERTDGFIMLAKILYKLDEKKIISDWIENGAPKYWGFYKKKGLIDKIKDLFK